MPVKASRLHRRMERQFPNRARISRIVSEPRSRIGSEYDESGERNLNTLHDDVKVAENPNVGFRGESIQGAATLGRTPFGLLALGAYPEVREKDVLTILGDTEADNVPFNVLAVGVIRGVEMTRFRLERLP